MSLFIKGATMPETCWECIDKHRLDHAAKCTIHNNLYHRLMNINDPILRQHRAEDCPLVNVAVPHGDLIDRDVLLRDHVHKDDIMVYYDDFVYETTIEYMPTIIEAEDFNESV